jgi:hypothetical protein
MTVARIFKRCPCPEDHWRSCPHQWVVRYHTTGGRSSRQREQAFGDDLREAEDFALKVEHDKRAHTFVDPKAGRVLFRDAAEMWLGQHLGADSSIATYRWCCAPTSTPQSAASRSALSAARTSRRSSSACTAQIDEELEAEIERERSNESA